MLVVIELIVINLVSYFFSTSYNDLKRENICNQRVFKKQTPIYTLRKEINSLIKNNVFMRNREHRFEKNPIVVYCFRLK